MRVSKSGTIYGFRKGNQINKGRIHTRQYPPNTYFRDFLKRMKPEKRRIWLNDFRKKISLSIRNNPEYLEKLRIRMIGNKYQENYLQKNPIWAKPDWGSCIPHRTVPPFVPVLYQRVPVVEATKYYVFGEMPPRINI